MTGAARTAASAKRSTSSPSKTQSKTAATSATRRRPERGGARVVPFADAARGLLRRTIVGAVDELVRARGWEATTMSDVATAAGVSRQTLYNEFGSRQALVEEYVRGEIEAMLAEVEAEVRARADDPRGALRTAFELFLRLASDEPVVRIIVADTEGGELIQLLTSVGRTVATGRVVALIVDVWPKVSAADAEVLAESLVRLAISHALLPTGDPHRTAEGVTRMIGPFADEILGVEV
jgi:AcrR family transcriptional regulator